MLVDFRAFDTLGEITVLGAVALTVYALLRRFRPAEESIESPQQQRVLPLDVVTDLVSPRTTKDEERGYLMVPSVIARLLYPVAIVVALHLLLRGHNVPGGGFVAGLTIAIVFLTQYLVAGTEWVEARSRLRPVRWIAGGALVAAASGLGALLLGYPFLTTHTAHVTLPLLGEVHLPSAMVFDVGVFAVVVGATLLIQIALAHQSIRAYRRGRSVGAPSAKDGGRGALMEAILALVIGVLAGSGVWLVLRPRTFQVILGLALISYAVNLFIFSVGSVGRRQATDRDAGRGGRSDPAHGPSAAGAGPHGDRHRLCDDGAVSRSTARIARAAPH